MTMSSPLIILLRVTSPPYNPPTVNVSSEEEIMPAEGNYASNCDTFKCWRRLVLWLEQKFGSDEL